MPDNLPESNRPPERKTPPAGGNLVWYLLALGVGALFLISLMETNNQTELTYMDLVKLIKQGSPQTNPKAAIEVRESVAGKEEVVRYSNLDNLKIGPHEITGNVTRQAPSADAENEKNRRHRDFSHGAGRAGKRQQRLVQLVGRKKVSQRQR